MLKDKLKFFLKKNYPALVRKYRDYSISKSFNNNYWEKKKDSFIGIVNDLKNKPFDETLPKNFNEIKIKHDRATLEINNTCNLDCIMCKTSLSTRKKGKMDSETLNVALERLKEAGVTHVTLHTIGDPLANPRLKEVFIELRKYNIKCSISTNGLLLYKHVDTLKEFLDICPSIRFSIDGVNKETYEKIRAKGKWEDLITNLDLCNNELRTKGLSTDINMTVSKDNFNEIGEFIVFFKKYISYPFMDFSFNFVNSLSPDNTYFNEANTIPEHTHINKMCHLVSGKVPYILIDGKLSVCCRDYSGELIIGDINKSSLNAVRSSKKLKSLQKAHTNGNLENYPLCKTCFIIDDRINIVFSGVLQYLLFMHPDEKAEYFQSKADELIEFLRNKELSTEKFTKLLN
ncbi:MAG: hypothetical protein CFH25_00389 [Alphaproteobacteria bacterium MarineAlpha6_Bin3]|nr:MAG: hypothetical protein CFH25_00389 [Alphaproteobacteria bacterium MarineAlpha6_Bin3]|tara:strand:- start:2265 stop:3470 length:1206 start_codon:yes stop_codon:yes gene_type:complete